MDKVVVSGRGIDIEAKTNVLNRKTWARLPNAPVSESPGKLLLFRPKTWWPCVLMYCIDSGTKNGYRVTHGPPFTTSPVVCGADTVRCMVRWPLASPYRSYGLTRRAGAGKRSLLIVN